MHEVVSLLVMRLGVGLIVGPLRGLVVGGTAQPLQWAPWVKMLASA